VTFTCSDATSGIDSCPAPVPAATEGANQAITGTAKDKAGNAAQASATVNLDKTPPTIAIASPLNGAVLPLPSVTVNGTVGDLLSGVASVTCQGAAATLSGANFNCVVPIAAGPNTIAVQATDTAGNTVQTSVSIQGGVPTLLSISPTAAQQGQSGISITITGQYTHFTNASVIDLGAGIAVGNVVATDATHLTAQLTIAANAAVNTRNLTVTTGTEAVTLANAFTVNGAPVITLVKPNSGRQGQSSLAVTISGQLTHWVQGTSTASFGAGIAVAALTINSGTSATAVLNIDPAAVVGARNVTVTTGVEVVTLTSGFTVSVANQPPTMSAGPDQSVTPLFDDFEGASYGPFWTFVGPGTATITTAMAHSGKQSIQFTTVSTYPWWVGLGYDFGLPVTGSVSVWLQGEQLTGGAGAGIFINDANNVEVAGIQQGQVNCNSCFTVRLLRGSILAAAHTFTASPSAWHLLELDTEPSGITFRFDGDIVYADPSVTSFRNVHFGPWSAPGYSAFFDDFRSDVSMAALNGSVMDDGLPAGATLSTAWSKTNGPGGVSFSNSTATFPDVAGLSNPITTAAAFSAPGSYTLNLAGTDSQLTSNSVVTVTVNPPPPAIAFVNPGTGQQVVQNLAIAIVGQYTHFTNSSVVALGAGITVSSLAAADSTHLSAQLAIAGNATVGPRTLTVTSGTEVVTLANAFTVTALVLPPSLSSVSPAAGQQGQQNLSVTITGSFTHFVQGTTTASFGLGITVALLTINSATSATAVLNIDPAAATGARNVTVTTGTEVVTLDNGFTVTAGTPAISQLSPNTGQQGQQNLSVAITGQYTHFVQGTTTATFGAGTTVASLVVNSPTHATAVLNIDPTAATGARDVTVTTSSEVAAITAGFVITAAVNQPPTVSAGPNRTITFPSAQITLNEYPIPTANSSPFYIITGADGNMWFTEHQGNKIGRISPAGIITEFPLANGGGPAGIAAGSDGNVWFTEYTGQRIGRITPSGVITEFPLPNSGSPWGITTGPDGNLWFTERLGNKVGRITAAGAITEFPLPAACSNALGIVTGPDGNLWFTEAFAQNTTICGTPRIGRITPGGLITEFAVPSSGSDFSSSFVEEIIVGPDGNLWFTLVGTDKIGRITTAGTITFFPVPTIDSEPIGIAIGPDGNLWFVEQSGNQFGRMTPVGGVTEFPVSSANSRPYAITLGSDCNLWIVEINGNKIGRVTPGFLPLTDTITGSVADDGLPVGATLNTAWSASGGVCPASLGSPTAIFADIAGQVYPVVTSATFSAAGTYTLTLTSSDSQLNSNSKATITVNPPQGPAILFVNPAFGQQGQHVSVSLIGQSTHWAQATTVATLGAGITVASLTINSATSATAALNIDPTAATGTQTVSLSTGAEVATLTNGFTVTAGTPVITQVNPNSGQQGQQNLSVNLTGQFTHWVQGTTTASFGLGITVALLTINSPTSATAVLNIDPAAALGSRNVTMTTGAEVVALPSGFSVQANHPPAITSLPPRGPVWENLPSLGGPPRGRDIGPNPNIYDVVNDRLIIFSGDWIPGPPSADVWVLANASGRNGTPTWIQLAPASPGPVGREYGSFTYVKESNRLIVCGGVNGASDCWVLTNANGLGGVPTWIRLPDMPNAFMGSAAYDSATRRLMVFGYGSSGTNNLIILSDADGIGTPTWSQPTATGPPPVSRFLNSVAYDPGTNRLIVFGGTSWTASSYNNLNDLWILGNANGASGTPQWIQMSPTGGPPSGRCWAGFSYDPQTNEAILFGGADNSVGDAFSDLWLLKNANGIGTPQWVQLNPVGRKPIGHFSSALGRDGPNRVLTMALGRWTDEGTQPYSSLFLTDNWRLNLAEVGAAVGTPFSYSVLATDPDGDLPSFSLTQSPDGMSISSTTGLISYLPTAANIGRQSVTVRVDDGGGLSATQTFEIVVVPAVAAIPPSVVSVVPNAGQPGTIVDVTVTAQNSNFVRGQTSVLFYNGPTTVHPYAESVTVLNAATAVVRLNIPANAQLGVLSFNIGTGFEIANAINAFTIQSGPVLTITSVAPSSGPQGGTAVVSIQGMKHALCAGYDHRQLWRRYHGCLPHGQLPNQRDGGAEHRSRCCHRRPRRDADDGSGSCDVEQRLHGDGRHACDHARQPEQRAAGAVEPSGDDLGAVHALQFRLSRDVQWDRDYGGCADGGHADQPDAAFVDRGQCAPGSAGDSGGNRHGDGGPVECVHRNGRYAGDHAGEPEHGAAGSGESLGDDHRTVHPLRSGNDHSRLWSRHHGSDADGQFSDERHGGAEHRFGSGGRQPKRHIPNRGRTGSLVKWLHRAGRYHFSKCRSGTGFDTSGIDNSKRDCCWACRRYSRNDLDAD